MKKTAISAFLVIVAVTMVSSVAAQQTDDATVDVDVASVADVDINPTSLSYTSNSFRNIEPGDFNATSDANFTGIEIENSGSENLTDIRVKSTEPQDRPFATGVSGEYDAGNFIQVRPQQEIGILASPDLSPTGTEDGNNDETGYHYPARVDFNASGDGLSYIKTPTTEGNAATDVEWRYGRFRSGDEEFFWAIATTPGGTDANACDGDSSNVELRVGNNPHTDQNIGTVDFTDDNDANYQKITAGDIVQTGNSDPYGRVNDTTLTFTDGTVKSYTVLMYCGESESQLAAGETEVPDTYVVRTRYDRSPLEGNGRLPETTNPLEQDTSNGRSLENLVDTTTQEFEPGDHFTLETAIEVPRGTAVGGIDTGTLTVRASTT